MSTSPRIDPADSIGHSASYYRRQLLEAQNEIQRLRNALTLAQAEITTLRTERRNVEAQKQAVQ